MGVARGFDEAVVDASELEETFEPVESLNSDGVAGDRPQSVSRLEDLVGNIDWLGLEADRINRC